MFKLRRITHKFWALLSLRVICRSLYINKFHKNKIHSYNENYFTSGRFKILLNGNIWAPGWQKKTYNKIWTFESDAYFESSVHVDPFLKISVIYHKIQKKLHAFKVVQCVKSENVISQNIMIHEASFNVAPFY